MESKIFSSLTKYARKDEITGLHISYYQHGNIYQHNFGYTNKQKDQPVTDQTLFEIGSLTKPLVATLFSILLKDKVIELDNPVSLFFDTEVINPVFDQITLRDLLTHASGLPRIPDTFFAKMKNNDMEDPYSCLTADDLNQYLKDPGALKTRGQYCYSNLGYGILGEILKKITSRPLRQVGKELLFDRIGMNDTDTIDNIKNHHAVATGHIHSGKESKYWHNDVLAGAGCFLSNGRDMMHFLQENICTKESGLNAAIHFTHLPNTRKAGLAWHYKRGLLSRVLGYNGYIWHNGMTGGFSSFIAFHKTKRTGLVLLANKAIPLDSYFYVFSSYC